MAPGSERPQRPPGVAFDENADLGTCLACRSRQPLDDRSAVGDGREADARGKRTETTELGSAENIGRQQEIGDPGIGHDLRLADGLDRHATRAEFDLPKRPGDGPVRLDMRSVDEIERLAMRLPTSKIGIRDRRIDEDRRCLEGFEGAVDRDQMREDDLRNLTAAGYRQGGLTGRMHDHLRTPRP